MLFDSLFQVKVWICGISYKELNIAWNLKS